MDAIRSLSTSPPELLAAIFSHACTDTGYTGYALNLVCKSFHEVCLDTSLDIQSAAVCGMQAMTLFLKMLGGRAQAKRRVVSLFLSYREKSGWESEEYADIRTSPVIRVARLMMEILRFVSPSHLKILHADWPHFWVTKVFERPVSLPNLVELYHTGESRSYRLSETYIAPAVEKLRLGSLFIEDPAEEEAAGLGVMLQHDCPLITHLVISPGCLQPPFMCDLLHFVYAYCKLSRSFKDVLLTYEPYEFPPMHMGLEYPSIIADELRIPTKLRRIIVENPPRPSDSPGALRLRGFYLSTRIALHQGYRAVASEAKKENEINEEEVSSGKRSLRILPLLSDEPHKEEKQFAAEAFIKYKTQWLDRTAGSGSGCWA